MSVADFNNDDWISTVFRFDPQSGFLVVEVTAKRKVRIVELQGFKNLLEVFGATIPTGFREMRFGDGAEMSEELREIAEHTNRNEFRWGCDFAIAPGSQQLIRIPASGPGKDKAVINVVYEYPKLFGLLKGKNGHYARLSPAETRDGATVL